VGKREGEASPCDLRFGSLLTFQESLGWNPESALGEPSKMVGKPIEILHGWGAVSTEIQLGCERYKQKNRRNVRGWSESTTSEINNQQSPTNQ
jgi:hypothetical protein